MTTTEMATPATETALARMTIPELREYARTNGMSSITRLDRKAELVRAIVAYQRNREATDPNAAITAEMHSKPCPGCGVEPEVRAYYRRTPSGIRCGYQCTCGAIVIDGIMTGSSPV